MSGAAGSGVVGIGGQGMVAPQNAFVNAGGQLNPVSFAFLFNVFNTAQNLLAQMTAAQADIATANANIATATSGVTTLQSDVAALQAQVAAIQSTVSTDTTNLATLQTQVDSILSRLAAANIP
ncbi:MAG: hypothetical protein FWD12_12440 [Alphaproteobacteria bacterium]|nr:hypothetical protein [Alphaproteobacteria bacterium]